MVSHWMTMGMAAGAEKTARMSGTARSVVHSEVFQQLAKLVGAGAVGAGAIEAGRVAHRRKKDRDEKDRTATTSPLAKTSGIYAGTATSHTQSAARRAHVAMGAVGGAAVGVGGTLALLAAMHAAKRRREAQKGDGGESGPAPGDSVALSDYRQKAGPRNYDPMTGYMSFTRPYA